MGSSLTVGGDGGGIGGCACAREDVRDDDDGYGEKGQGVLIAHVLTESERKALAEAFQEAAGARRTLTWRQLRPHFGGIMNKVLGMEITSEEVGELLTLLELRGESECDVTALLSVAARLKDGTAKVQGNRR